MGYAKVAALMGFKRGKGHLNYASLEGNRTLQKLYKVLKEADVKNAMDYLFFNPEKPNEKGGLQQLWHLTYSISSVTDLERALIKHFDFYPLNLPIVLHTILDTDRSTGVCQPKAIKKLLPHLMAGLKYSEACDAVGYDHSGYKTKSENGGKTGTYTTE